MSNTQSPICYLNGEYKPLAEASLSVKDVGILRGYGVFDFLRTYHGKPFHLMDHIQRFFFSAQQIGMTLPLGSEEIAEIVVETLERNRAGEYAIRLLATGGGSDNNFMPAGESGLAIIVEPLAEPAEAPYQQGVKIITTDLKREFPTVKSTNYIGAIMAMRRATAEGAIEALYVDEAGQLSECTRSNIFFVMGETIVTADTNLLEGITRKVLLKLLPERHRLEVRPISLDEALDADEAFLTSSTKEVLPVVTIDTHTIGTGRPGPVTQACLQQFKAYAWEE